MQLCDQGIYYTQESALPAIAPSKSMIKYRGVKVKPQSIPAPSPRVAILKYRGNCYIKSTGF
jgi:hypothetical protein